MLRLLTVTDSNTNHCKTVTGSVEWEIRRKEGRERRLSNRKKRRKETLNNDLFKVLNKSSTHKDSTDHRYFVHLSFY